MIVASLKHHSFAPRAQPMMPWVWQTGGLNNNYQYGMMDGTPPVTAATALTQRQIVSIAYRSGTVLPGQPLPALTNANGNQLLITGTNSAPGTFYPTLYTTASAYPLGQPFTFGVLVVDATGTPLANIPVTVAVSGANPNQYQATTDATGTALFSYAGTTTGNDILQAQATLAGVPSLISNEMTVTWENYPAPPKAGF